VRWSEKARGDFGGYMFETTPNGYAACTQSTTRSTDYCCNPSTSPPAPPPGPPPPDFGDPGGGGFDPNDPMFGR
jgi:hypothetical protein